MKEHELLLKPVFVALTKIVEPWIIGKLLCK
jgi:hypothetical protein